MSAPVAVPSPADSTPAASTIGISGAGNLVRKSFRNAAAHFAGRNIISLTRLVVASSIARMYGREVFGQYSLLLVLLATAEWLLDFGTSDITVREINRSPLNALEQLRILTATKLIQIGIASLFLLTLVVCMQYPQAMVQGSFLALGSLVFFAGTLIYHAIFKASLTIEREVAAELISVVLMAGLIRGFHPPAGAAIPILMASHMLSRAAFFAGCWVLGRVHFRLSIAGVKFSDMRSLLKTSAPLGVIGLVVIVYESLDLLILSRTASLTEVAYYSGAQRYLSPFVVALTGIGSTLYPVAASFWPESRNAFNQSCQRATEMVFLVAGLAVSCILAGSDFLMALIAPNLVPGAAILRILAVLLFFKAATNTLGPVLYVLDQQRIALKMVFWALLLKGALNLLLAPRFAVRGVAAATLIVDCGTAIYTLYLVWKGSGLRVNWNVPLRTVAITFVAASAATAVFSPASIWAPASAASLFILQVLLTRTVRFTELSSLLRPGKTIA